MLEKVKSTSPKPGSTKIEKKKKETPAGNTANQTTYSAGYYKYKKGKTVWLVSGLVGAGAGAFAYLQSGKYYDQYLAATTDAVSLHQKVKTFDTVYPICFALAGFSAVEFILQSGKQKRAKYQKIGFYPQPVNHGAALSLVYNF